MQLNQDKIKTRETMPTETLFKNCIEKATLGAILILILLCCSACERLFDAFNSPAEQAYLMGLRAQKGEARDTDPLECFNRAISLDPHRSRYYSARAELYFWKRQFAEALRDLNEAVSLSPNWYYLYFERGNCKCQLNDFISALADFDTAIKAQPDNAQYYSGVALANLGMNSPDKALEAIEKTIALDPMCLRWHFYRGVILSRMGRHKDAVSEFAKTEAFTIMLEDNKQKQVFFDGEIEYTKARALSPQQLLSTWPYAPSEERAEQYFLKRGSNEE